MPIRGVRLHTGLLALALCSGAQVLANPFLQQQYLIGDVYPYDYSPEDFRTATSNPAVQDTFPVPGYDITAGNGSTSTTTRDFRLDGWRLAVSVSSDVAIPGNSPDSQGGSKVFHTAQLSLTPPTRLSDALKKDSADQNWSVCSAIWTLGLSQTALDAASKSGSGSGSGGPASSCSGFLPSECISEMEAGFNTAGFCQNQTMPASCTVFFANGTDGVTRGSNLPQSGFFFSSLHLLMWGLEGFANDMVSYWWDDGRWGVLRCLDEASRQRG